MKATCDTTRILAPIGLVSTCAMRRMDEEGTEIQFQVPATLQWRFWFPERWYSVESWMWALTGTHSCQLLDNWAHIVYWGPHQWAFLQSYTHSHNEIKATTKWLNLNRTTRKIANSTIFERIAKRNF